MKLIDLFGIAGLLVLTVGVLLKSKKNQNILFMIGGGLLEAYSISIGNVIFIILQAVFIVAAFYNLAKK